LTAFVLLSACAGSEQGTDPSTESDDNSGEILIRINVIDGLRIYFANGEIAHIRPSENAPQLRIYAVADSQARAEAIVELRSKSPGVYCGSLNGLLSRRHSFFRIPVQPVLVR
jgi:hypothetical protein